MVSSCLSVIANVMPLGSEYGLGATIIYVMVTKIGLQTFTALCYLYISIVFIWPFLCCFGKEIKTNVHAKTHCKTALYG